MENIIKKATQILATGLMVGGLVAGVAAVATPAPAHAQANDALCNGVLATDDNGNTGGGCSTIQADAEGTGTSTVGGLIKKILNIFSYLVGAISVIMIIIGGFRYITSGGDSTAVGGAKNTILYAIVGLVIVIFAQVIVKYVIGSLTSQ